MPWKETRVQDQRTLFIAAWLAADAPFAELCRDFGISRKTGYKWRERYDATGPSGLSERTSAPWTHPNATPQAIEDAIVAFRREHMDYGPRTLRARLLALDAAKPEAERTAWPSIATFAVVLGRHGLSASRRRRKPRLPLNPDLAQPDEPNDVWAMDFKGRFKCGDGARCDPFTLMDLTSRFLLRCVALPKLDTVHVQGVLEAAFRQYGLPRVLRSDNGPPFGSVALAGLSALSLWLIRLGVRPEHIEKGKPQQNGCLERLHRTLKAACAKPPQPTLRAQQQRLLDWREEYNTERPHQALGDQPPAVCYRRSPRYFPSQVQPFKYPPDATLRRVMRDGAVQYKRGLVELGTPFVGQWVAFVPLGDPDARYLRLCYRQQPLALYDAWTGRFATGATTKELLKTHGQQESWHW